MNGNTPTDITFSFSGFSQRAGVTDEHTDGWGIAFFEGMPAAVEKEAQMQIQAQPESAPVADKGLRLFIDHHAASRSPVADLVRRYPIKSRNIVAHIRKATQGRVALQNCHPFVRELWGHYWVFAHNGNLENYQPRLHSHFQPVGDTDSERAYCLWSALVLGGLCHHGALTAQGIAVVAQRIIGIAQPVQGRNASAALRVFLQEGTQACLRTSIVAGTEFVQRGVKGGFFAAAVFGA